MVLNRSMKALPGPATNAGLTKCSSTVMVRIIIPLMAVGVGLVMAPVE
jgi:hypothetical protein